MVNALQQFKTSKDNIGGMWKYSCGHWLYFVYIHLQSKVAFMQIYSLYENKHLNKKILLQ